jgi:hypothetical protein
MKHRTGLRMALICMTTSFVQAADPDPVAVQTESKAIYQEFMDFYGQWLDKSKQE